MTAHTANVTYTARPGLSTLAGRWAGMGPYYAMFPLEFALAVVGHFSKPGQSILDPFCGRGTTLYAASYQSRRGLGVEINPVGWVFGKTKLRAAQEKDVLLRLRDVAEYAHEFKEVTKSLPQFFRWAFSFRVCCFLLSARYLLNWQNNIVDRTLVAFLLVYLHGKWGQALSNQLRQTKSMSPDYSVHWWRERGMRPPEIDPIEFMTKRIQWRYQKGRPWSRFNDVILGDAVEVLSRDFVRKSSGFQLLLTSPPYYSVTNYFYDQWLRLWLLGGAEKPKSMGETYKSKFQSQAAYKQLLETVFGHCSTLMKHNAIIYVRTDAREFTLKTTIESLKIAFPSKQIEIHRRPLSGKSQTALFGDNTLKPGEVDLIMI